MKRNQGITLVALVITIIILIILAGIVLGLSIGKNGLISKTKESRLAYSESEAREKLELVLLDMQAEKQTNLAYNKDNYLTDKIEENGMSVDGDIVAVDGWQFRIDRDALQITEEIGKGDKIVKGKPRCVPILDADHTENIISEKFPVSDGNMRDAYLAFDGDESTFAGTVGFGGNNTIGAYLGYDFGEPVRVIEVTGKIRMLSYKIQYSDDLENWIDVITSDCPEPNQGGSIREPISANVGSHRYWCLRVDRGQLYDNYAALIWSLQFYTEHVYDF